MKIDRISITFVTILMIEFLIMVVIPIPIEQDCRGMYMDECNQCRNDGMAYEICSGACYESDNISVGCEIDMDKQCSDIGHGCAMGGYDYAMGIGGLISWDKEG